MARSYLHIALYCLALCINLPIAAQELTYDILGFGSQRVLIQIQGQIPLGTTSNMSSDGLSARISALGVSFMPKNPQKALPSVVSSVQQVKRGLSNDLVINLTSPADLSLTPGSTDLKIFLKIKKQEVAAHHGPHATPVGGNLKSRNMRLPFRVLSTRKISGFGDNTLIAPGLTLVLPDLASLKSLTSLSTLLHFCAYGFDLVWSMLSGTELQILESESGTETTISQKEENTRLNTLVQDLTKELVELREELSKKDREFSEHKAGLQNAR